jgi:hypothetical protein
MKVFKQKKSTLRNLQKEQIKLSYSQGCSINDIMKEVDMSFGQIKNYLVTESILKIKPKLSHKTKEQLISDFFKKGKTARDIGIALNLKTRIITYILRKLRLADNKRHYASQVFNSSNALDGFKRQLGIKVRQDYSSGKSKEKIMEEHKISVLSVNSYLMGNRNRK